jgi:hypothetical protein
LSQWVKFTPRYSALHSSTNVKSRLCSPLGLGVNEWVKVNPWRQTRVV